MSGYYLLFCSISFGLTIFFTLIVKKIALKLNIIDDPGFSWRKIHKHKIPLLGGLAIFTGFFVTVFLAMPQLTAGNLDERHWIGFFAGACFLMIGGILDDKYNLQPKYQLIFPLLAIISVLAGGIQIEKITNPLGGYIYLDSVKILIFQYKSVPFYIFVLSDILISIWLLGMMYTTKLLDGVDGLVTSVAAIGSFIIFLFTMTTQYFQPDIGLAALILCASCLGFLLFNWHPAKIFLGEGGSLLLGYVLGVLAIISGGKIAIALLVMGIPILDVLWTVVRRASKGRNPFKFSDRKHLHHRLLDLGISQRKTVLIFCAFSLIFGLCGLYLQSIGKMLALALLLIIMLLLIIGFHLVDRKNNSAK